MNQVLSTKAEDKAQRTYVTCPSHRGSARHARAQILLCPLVPNCLLGLKNMLDWKPS